MMDLTSEEILLFMITFWVVLLKTASISLSLTDLTKLWLKNECDENNPPYSEFIVNYFKYTPLNELK